MNIEVVAKDVVINDEVQGRINKKLEKILDRTNKETPVRVLLETKKNGFASHINLTIKGKDLVGQAENKNMIAALDEAMEKIERQVNKLFEKITDHR